MLDRASMHLCRAITTGLVSHREFKKFCIANSKRVRKATALAQETKQEEERKRQREMKGDKSITIDTKMGGSTYLSSMSIRELARQESAGSGLDSTLVTSMSSTLPVSTYNGSTLRITSGADMPVSEALGDWARDSNKVTYHELQKGPRGRKKKKTLVCTSVACLVRIKICVQTSSLNHFHTTRFQLHLHLTAQNDAAQEQRAPQTQRREPSAGRAGCAAIVPILR